MQRGKEAARTPALVIFLFYGQRKKTIRLIFQPLTSERSTVANDRLPKPLPFPSRAPPYVSADRRRLIPSSSSAPAADRRLWRMAAGTRLTPPPPPRGRTGRLADGRSKDKAARAWRNQLPPAARPGAFMPKQTASPSGRIKVKTAVISEER